jgi:hypothetical protein
VQVRCDEGVATHIGPKPCVDAREGVGEASAGGVQRPTIEPRQKNIPGRRRRHVVRKATWLSAQSRASNRPGVVRDPGMCRRSLYGSREISRSTSAACRTGPHREGEEPSPLMHDREKSDHAIIATRPTNKAGIPATEPVERRAGTKGNANQQSTRWAQDRGSMTQALERVRNAARQRKKERFTALFHHLSPAMLRTAFLALKRDAVPGVDGLTWLDYETDLDRRIQDLHDRAHGGTYRALASRRRYIPKPDGRQCPLAIAALEDKIVQRATVAVLNEIYEEDFLGFSYGFRPRRGTAAFWVRQPTNDPSPPIAIGGMASGSCCAPSAARSRPASGPACDGKQFPMPRRPDNPATGPSNKL